MKSVVMLCRGRSARCLALVSAAALVVASCPSPLAAAWSSDPTEGTRLTALEHVATAVRTVPDGAGGSFIVWSSMDPNSFEDDDIYAQRFNAAGEPQWTAGGVPVAVVSETPQNEYRILPDGAGGVFIVWQDGRDGKVAIYGQRLTATGAVASGWTANGTPLVAPSDSMQVYPLVQPDGSGGFYLTWTRVAGSDWTARVTRFTADGTVAPGWTTDGLSVDSAAGTKRALGLVTDSNGGVVVLYNVENNPTLDLRARRFLPSGTADPAWGTSGTVLHTQYFTSEHHLVADNAGGVIFTWASIRNGAQDSFALRLTSTGSVAPGWTAGGTVLGSGPNHQTNPRVLSDGADGAFFAWVDYIDLRLTRLAGDATPAAGWPAGGLLISGASGYYEYPVLQSDGAGGVLMAVERFDSTTAKDVVAFRYTGSGTPVSGWSASGTMVSNAPNHQNWTGMAADGSGGAVLTWIDSRGIYADAYAAHVGPNGVLPVSVSAFSID